MSQEQYFCEYCGHDSQSQERCTHCGRDIADLFTHPATFQIPAWGRMTIRLLDPVRAGEVWKELATMWGELEDYTNHKLMPSQMEKFNTLADSIELYGSEWAVHKAKEVLRGRGTIEFQELSQDELPKRPAAPPPPRRPYVPRSKR